MVSEGHSGDWHLSRFPERPWWSLKHGKELTERWLSDRLREYEVRPRYLRIGEVVARGYCLSDFTQAFRRYISEAEVEALRAEASECEEGKSEVRGGEEGGPSSTEAADG